MKTKLLIIALILLAIYTNGQGKYFTLTTSGFVSTSDTETKFVVIPIEGKTQAELYKVFLNKLNGMYVSPKDVLNPIENESISVNGIAKGAIKDEMNKKYNLNYTLVFLFKDGRIRVDSPAINKLLSYGINNDKELYINSGADLFGQYYSSIWNKKGILKEPTAKQELEVYFDNYIDALLQESKKSEEW